MTSGAGVDCCFLYILSWYISHERIVRFYECVANERDKVSPFYNCEEFSLLLATLRPQP